MRSARIRSAWGRWVRVSDWIHLRLVRATLSTRYMPEIDGLRFVAIAAVVLFHYSRIMARMTGAAPVDDLAYQIIRTGNVGVELFFALSGFILAIPFFSARHDGRPFPSVKAYFLRRLTRLEPPYLINLLLIFWVYRMDRPDALEHLFWSALYSYGFVYDALSRINFVAWSLEVEVQFYVLMPLAIWLLLRLRNRWLRRAALAGPIMCSDRKIDEGQVAAGIGHSFSESGD